MKSLVTTLTVSLALAGCGYLPSSGDRAANSRGLPDSRDRYSDTYTFDPRDVPDDIARRVAEALAQSRSPLLARARILDATRLGFLYPEEGRTAQQLIDWYSEQRLYARVDYLARILGEHWTQRASNNYWMEAAEHMLRQDAFEEAERALHALSEPMTQEMRERRESLLGLVLLLQSRTQEAVTALERRQGFPNIRRMDHFNFAVAMVGHERRLEGLSLLDELAEMPTRNPEEQAISDRANMALGWVWLKAGQGGAARATFKRVSLEGSYSNLALLGLSWAELVPDGEVQRVQFRRKLGCGDIRQPPEGTQVLLFRSYRICRSKDEGTDFLYFRRFAFEPGGTKRQRHDKALLWLSELAKRDASEPAVQESLLGVGYVLAQQGRTADAIKAYRAAVRRYDAEIERLSGLAANIRAYPEDAVTSLASNQSPAQFKELRSSRAYANLVTELGFLREAETILEKISAWVDQQIPHNNRRQALVSYIGSERNRQASATAARIHEYQRSLTGIAQSEIDKTLNRLRQYRDDALLATARLYDVDRP